MLGDFANTVKNDNDYTLNFETMKSSRNTF